jgi:hypothetical protein
MAATTASTTSPRRMVVRDRHRLVQHVAVGAKAILSRSVSVFVLVGVLPGLPELIQAAFQPLADGGHHFVHERVGSLDGFARVVHEGHLEIVPLLQDTARVAAEQRPALRWRGFGRRVEDELSESGASRRDVVECWRGSKWLNVAGLVEKLFVVTDVHAINSLGVAEQGRVVVTGIGDR